MKSVSARKRSAPPVIGELGPNREYRFTVYGEPVGQERARKATLRNGRVIYYTPSNTVNWQERINWVAQQIRQEMGMAGKLLDGPLVLQATFFRLRPKSLPKRVLFPLTKPDWDNLGKAVTDALEQVLYTNDSRIVDAVVRKRFGEPRVEIVIREAVEADL